MKERKLCLRLGSWREYLDLKEKKDWEKEESYVMRNSTFTIFKYYNDYQTKEY
jgi:hypothetical protein